MKYSELHPSCALLYVTRGKPVKLQNFFKSCLGIREDKEIWVVDGGKVSHELYPAYVMAGHHQRYRWNPPCIIMLDGRIGVEEQEYTIRHELEEWQLMATLGWTYNRAHDAALHLEKRLRLEDRALAQQKIESLKLDPALDPSLVSQIAGVYRMPYGQRDGLSIWIVDGPRIRCDLDGDFCFGGHDLKFDFIPKNEIWLDSAMSVEQAHYTLIEEITERQARVLGKNVSDAYDFSASAVLYERDRQAQLVKALEASLPPVRYGKRFRGVPVERTDEDCCTEVLKRRK